MKILKADVKRIKESYMVVNGWSKTFRNPKNSFAYLMSNNEYLLGDYEQNGNDYIYQTGHVVYIVTLA